MMQKSTTTTDQSLKVSGEMPKDDAPSAATPTSHKLTVYQARRGWAAFDLRGFWRIRDLLFFFTCGDVLVRYKTGGARALWAFCSQFFHGSFHLVFNRALGVKPDPQSPMQSSV
jgi:hypothetical protein